MMKKLIVCLGLAAFAMGSTLQAGEDCAKTKAGSACSTEAKVKASACCPTEKVAAAAKSSCCAKKVARARAALKGGTLLVRL